MLRLCFQGMSKASVGRRLNISEETVKDYINRGPGQYARIGRHGPTKTALLTRALEDGLITLAKVRDGYPPAAGGQR